jgi:hypothetical protein
MTDRGASFVCAVVSLSLFSGCVGGGYGTPLSSSRVSVFPDAGVAMLLLAAGDEDDEFVGLLTRPAPPEQSAVRASRFGVRVGILTPMAPEEGTWSTGLRAGVYYRGAGGTVYEIGADYTSVEADLGMGATVSTTIYSVRCDILLGRWSDLDRKATFYLLGGGELGMETGIWESTGDELEARAGGVNLGIGLASPKGSWDARFVYSILMGSDNAAGAIGATMGFAF